MATRLFPPGSDDVIYVVDLSSYVRELLRFKLTTDLVQQQGTGPKTTLKSMIADLTSGKSVASRARSAEARRRLMPKLPR